MDLTDIGGFLQDAGYSGSFEVQPVRKEASTRSYYRIAFADGSTVILCTGLDPASETYADFVNLTGHLRSHNIPAPALLASHPDGRLLLSDGGRDELAVPLAASIHARDRTTVRSYLQAAIDLLVDIHRLPVVAPVSQRHFDTEKLQWEMDSLFRHIDAASAASGQEIPYTAEFRIFTYEVCEHLAGQRPLVFTHRDFHSRNLLTSPSGFTVIDYQDARLGLPWYDLASFLYDPYVPLSLEDRRFGFQYYVDRAGVRPEWNLFLMQAVQRVWKALGTYVFMAHEKRRLEFAESIPAALDRLEEIIQLARMPDSAFVFITNFRKSLLPYLVPAAAP